MIAPVVSVENGGRVWAAVPVLTGRGNPVQEGTSVAV